MTGRLLRIDTQHTLVRCRCTPPAVFSRSLSIFTLLLALILFFSTPAHAQDRQEAAVVQRSKGAPGTGQDVQVPRKPARGFYPSYYERDVVGMEGGTKELGSKRQGKKEVSSVVVRIPEIHASEETDEDGFEAEALEDVHEQFYALARVLVDASVKLKAGQYIAIDLAQSQVEAALGSKHQTLTSLRDSLAHATPGSREDFRALWSLGKLLMHSVSNGQVVEADVVVINATKQHTPEIVSQVLVAISTVLLTTAFVLMRRNTTNQSSISTIPPSVDASTKPASTNPQLQAGTDPLNRAGEQPTSDERKQPLPQILEETEPAQELGQGVATSTAAAAATTTSPLLHVATATVDADSVSESGDEVAENSQEPRSNSTPIKRESQAVSSAGPQSNSLQGRRRMRHSSRRRSESPQVRMSRIVQPFYSVGSYPAQNHQPPMETFQWSSIFKLAALLGLAVFCYAVWSEARDMYHDERIRMESHLEDDACQRLSEVKQGSWRGMYEGFLEFIGSYQSLRERCIQQRSMGHKLHRMETGGEGFARHLWRAIFVVVAKSVAEFVTNATRLIGYMDGLKLAWFGTLLAVPSGIMLYFLLSTITLLIPLFRMCRSQQQQVLQQQQQLAYQLSYPTLPTPGNQPPPALHYTPK